MNRELTVGCAVLAVLSLVSLARSLPPAAAAAVAPPAAAGVSSGHVEFVFHSGMAEVRRMGGVGGGRGVFALRDILPGEVIDEEMPLVELRRGDRDVWEPSSQKTAAAGEQEEEVPFYERLAGRVLLGKKSAGVTGASCI